VSLIGDVWCWYAAAANREAVAPLLGFAGSLIVGLGTVTVGALVARAALRQARTAIEQVKTATDVAQTASRQADIASRRHNEQTQADRARLITDTFSKAVEQLGSKKMEVRVGGIYTLERPAGEALDTRAEVGSGSDVNRTVMETLATFVRERARWQPASAKGGPAGKSDYLWGLTHDPIRQQQKSSRRPT
jgi:hypothetical protein